jgi:hypothetical protein
MSETITLPRFEDFGSTAISALEDPQGAVAATAALLKEDRNAGRPEVQAAGDTHTTLERGIYRSGRWHRQAEVRELTGEDEEAMASASTLPYKVFETLLVRGTVRVGDEPMTRQLAGELLIGDRELLVLAIRKASFGDELEFEALPCPHCGEETDLTVPLDCIPTVTLEDPDQTEFEVPLRKGAVARVSLPTGADQDAVFDLKEANQGKQNSEILRRCVISVTHADGRVEHSPSPQKLLISDRKKILAFLAATQPGPRYDEFAFTHETCGKEVELPISMAVLFRGL